MKITGIRATPAISRSKGRSGGPAASTPALRGAVAEIETDQGVVGLSEAPSIDVVRGIEAMGERLVGADPLDIAGCECRCGPLGLPVGVQANPGG